MNPSPPKDQHHSWSISVFERCRRHLTDFIRNEVVPFIDSNECPRILIHAPVKCGKREMVECIAMRDLAHSSTRVHAFVSAFHRTADESQRGELKLHNLEVFSLNKRTEADRCCQWIHQQMDNHKTVVLHIDECDFGSGDKQILGQTYRFIRNRPQITAILYSATPHEVLFSDDIVDESGEIANEYNDMVDDFTQGGHVVNYTPPEGFCGPKRFLDEGLVHDAHPFFHKVDNRIQLSDQGRHIITGLRASIAAQTGRNIIVLRLSYADLGGGQSERKENKAIYQFLQMWHTIPELNGCVVFVDKNEKYLPNVIASVQTEKIKWSDRVYWMTKCKDVPLIMVADQTSSRSTEWACHDRVFTYHDFRNTITFSTISQAQERVNHYVGKYGTFQPIHVYGHMKTFLLSAGRITYDEYLHMEWTKRKVDRRVAGTTEPVYMIRSTSHPFAPHPDYQRPLPRRETDRVLLLLGCLAEVKVSPRVRGGFKKTRVFGVEFYPCTKDAFADLKTRLDRRFPHTFNNPFTRSETEGFAADGRYRGFLREWKVFDYDVDIVPQPGFGVLPDCPRLTVCYRGGVLGVALRYDTGERRNEKTLETFRSMYVAPPSVRA